jgi:hypothetical protein
MSGLLSIITWARQKRTAIIGAPKSGPKYGSIILLLRYNKQKGPEASRFSFQTKSIHLIIFSSVFQWCCTFCIQRKVLTQPSNNTESQLQYKPTTACCSELLYIPAWLWVPTASVGYANHGHVSLIPKSTSVPAKYLLGHEAGPQSHVDLAPVHVSGMSVPTVIYQLEIRRHM